MYPLTGVEKPNVSKDVLVSSWDISLNLYFVPGNKLMSKYELTEYASTVELLFGRSLPPANRA